MLPGGRKIPVGSWKPNTQHKQLIRLCWDHPPKVINCIADINCWMSNFLQFSTEKSEIPIVGWKKSEAENVFTVEINVSDIQWASLKPWYYVGHGFNFENHVTNIRRTALCHLKICKNLEQSYLRLETQVSVFIFNSLDYCYAPLAGSNPKFKNQLGSIQNGAASVLSCTQKFEYSRTQCRALKVLCNDMCYVKK